MGILSDLSKATQFKRTELFVESDILNLKSCLEILLEVLGPHFLI